jgi:hypothetical protein
LQSDIKISNVSQYQDLVIEVINEGTGYSDPNLYINLKDQEPTWQKHDLMCAFYGADICIISGKELKNVTKVTIGVNCLGDCSFRIQAELSAEINLSPGKMHNIYFAEN